MLFYSPTTPIYDCCSLLAISYNRPKFCPSASWNATGITFADISTVGASPREIFVDVTNAVYVASYSFNLVRMWSEGGTIIRNLTSNLNNPYGLFVTDNDDVYADNGNNGQVVKWTLNTTNSVPVMNVSSYCYSLFIDTNNSLYCALDGQHKVLKTFLDNNNTNPSVTVAGTGTPGSSSTMLHSPDGLFINTNFDLYVADSDNDRIQRFPFGQSNGITVVINGSLGVFTLDCPTDVFLDADDYLFIVDGYYHRVLGSGPDGFRCVVGCTGTNGSASNQLYNPRYLAFDNLGNLFVVDKDNNRIQKFLLTTNNTACSKSKLRIFIHTK